MTAFATPATPTLRSSSFLSHAQGARLCSRQAASPVLVAAKRQVRPPQWTALITTQSAAAKDALFSALAPLDNGRAILGNKKEQDRIEKLIQALERENPSLRPTEDPRIAGKWRLEYCTSRTILQARLPPFLRPKDLLQVISSDGTRITNIEIIQPLGKENTNLRWTNKVVVASKPDGYKRVDVQFQTFELFNQVFKVDVSQNKAFAGFLDTTYLDNDVRISRGDEGNVFVLTRA